MPCLPNVVRMMAPIFCSRHDIDKFKRTQCEYVLLMTGPRNVEDWQNMTENIFGIAKNRLFFAEVVSCENCGCMDGGLCSFDI